MNSEQLLSFNYGMVMSVSASEGVCTVQTDKAQTEMKIPAGKVYQAIQLLERYGLIIAMARLGYCMRE